MRFPILLFGASAFAVVNATFGVGATSICTGNLCNADQFAVNSALNTPLQQSAQCPVPAVDPDLNVIDEFKNIFGATEDISDRLVKVFRSLYSVENDIRPLQNDLANLNNIKYPNGLTVFIERQRYAINRLNERLSFLLDLKNQYLLRMDNLRAELPPISPATVKVAIDLIRSDHGKLWTLEDEDGEKAVNYLITRVKVETGSKFGKVYPISSETVEILKAAIESGAFRYSLYELLNIINSVPDKELLRLGLKAVADYSYNARMLNLIRLIQYMRSDTMDRDINTLLILLSTGVDPREPRYFNGGQTQKGASAIEVTKERIKNDPEADTVARVVLDILENRTTLRI
jgi:hypothetical protein